MKLSQVFCSHIFKLEERKSLYFSSSRVSGIVYNKTEYYAVKLVCIKCQKEKWEKRELDITHG